MKQSIEVSYDNCIIARIQLIFIFERLNWIYFPNTLYDNARLHRIYLVVFNKQCFLAYEFKTCLSCMVLLSNTIFFLSEICGENHWVIGVSDKLFNLLFIQVQWLLKPMIVLTTRTSTSCSVRVKEVLFKWKCTRGANFGFICVSL